MFGGYEDRTLSPGAVMSGLIRIPWKDTGPRLLKMARAFDWVVAPTVNASSYWAGGPSLPMVWQPGPELPAANTGTIPAARMLTGFRHPRSDSSFAITTSRSGRT